MQDYRLNTYTMLGNRPSRILSNEITGPYPVSLAIHTGCLPKLSLQSADLLLEIVSFVFPLNGLFLKNTNRNNSPKGTNNI